MRAPGTHQHGAAASRSVPAVRRAQRQRQSYAVGAVQKDLKPSNLFLTNRRDGSPLVKVLDFGISKLSPSSGAARSELLPSEASITAPDAIVGSPLYMSPEQLQSAKRVDARTDIWSLGVVLQELLTGRRPFEADSFMAIGAKIAAGAPSDLREGCPEAPEGLVAVVQRCLEKDPARRFGSIAELARALEPYAPEASRLSIERITRVAGGASAVEAAAPVTGEAVPGHASARPGSSPAAALTQRRGVLVLGGGAALALGAALLAARRAPVVEEGTAAPSSSTSARSGSTVAARETAPPNDVGSRRAPTPGATSLADAGAPEGARRSQSPRSSAARPSSKPPRPKAQTSRVAPAATGRPEMPAPAGSRSTAQPPPYDALDPMNPALIRR